MANGWENLLKTHRMWQPIPILKQDAWWKEEPALIVPLPNQYWTGIEHKTMILIKKLIQDPVAWTGIPDPGIALEEIIRRAIWADKGGEAEMGPVVLDEPETVNPAQWAKRVIAYL